MKLAGFNFTKIHAEKQKNQIKEIKIDSKINIASIESIKSDLINQKESLLGVEFDYSIKYKNLATLEFKGNLVLVLNSKDANKIIKDFKNKKISDDFRISIFNIIMKKSSIKALQLEEELNLPYHFKLPSLRPEKK
jgi:hypothetical protein